MEIHSDVTVLDQQITNKKDKQLKLYKVCVCVYMYNVYTCHKATR